MVAGPVPDRTLESLCYLLEGQSRKATATKEVSGANYHCILISVMKEAAKGRYAAGPDTDEKINHLRGPSPDQRKTWLK